MATRPPIDWQQSNVTPTHLVPFAPPPPETGFMENFRASASEALLVGNTYAEQDRRYDSYQPIVDALNQGRPQDRQFRNPARWGTDPRRGEYFEMAANYPEEEEMRIFDEIQRRRRSDPQFLAGVPDNAPAFRAQLTAQAQARLGEIAQVHAGATRLGSIGALAGGLTGSMQDSANLFLLPMGGAGGETYLSRVGYAAISNALVEAALQPVAVHNYDTLGEELTPWDSARSIMYAAIGGGLLHGTIEGGIHVAGGAPRLYDRAAEHLFNAMPEGIQRRWAGAATIDDVPLTDILRATIPPEHWTPDLRAAVNVVDRERDLREASPFEPSPTGDAAHAESLQDALDRLEREARPAPAAVEPAPNVSRVSPPPQPARAAPVDDVAAIEDYMRHVRGHESAGNDAVDNIGHTSSAGGRFQFTDGTFRSYYRRLYGADPGPHPAPALKHDGAIQDRLMRALTADNAATLRRNGYDVDRGNLFLLHFLGPEDGIKVLHAAPGTRVEGLIHPESIAANRTILPGRSAGDVIAWSQRAMGGHAPEMRGGAVPEAIAGAGDDGAAAELAVAEALAASRAAEAPEPTARDAVPAYESAPVLRRDLFGSEEEWRTAQDRLDREFALGGENRPLESGSGAPGRETAAEAPGVPAAENASERPDLAGVQLHGARGEVPDLQEGYYNPANIYGGQDTFYTTDAFDIARGYGRRREAARVYAAREREPVTMFDMEAPLPVDRLEKLFGVDRDDIGLVPMAIDEAVGEGGAANLRQVMDEIRDASGGEGVTRHEVQEIFDTAISNLRSEGFGGMRHVGGLKTSRAPHEVKIYFDAPNQLDLEEVWRAGAPDLAVAAQALQHFDDPDGAGAKVQTESLEHDLRLDAGEDNVRTGAGEALPEGAPNREHGIPAQASRPIASFFEAPRAKGAPRGPRYFDPVMRHADHKAAKAGDVAAAVRLVDDLVDPATLETARAELAGARFVPVIAEEATGRNAIPLALARKYAAAAGGEVELGIHQNVRAHHTGAGAAQRMASRPLFAGEVEPGRAYVIVDDVGVMGGTVAALADHIQRGGGEVSRVVLLASGADELALTPKQRASLEESGLGKAGSEEFGIEPGALTRDEATWLSAFRTPERLREYLADKLGARGDREDGRAGSGGGGADRGEGGDAGGVREEAAPFAGAAHHFQLDEAGEAKPLADILDDIDRQRKAADAIRGCLK